MIPLCSPALSRNRILEQLRTGQIDHRAAMLWLRDWERANPCPISPPPVPKVIGPDDVDIEHRATAGRSARGRRGRPPERVEAAWFVPTERDFDALAKRLTSDASPPQMIDGRWARNSETFRLTALLDNRNGNVHLLSTYENNREVRVTRFAEDLVPPNGRVSGRMKSHPPRDVLNAKLRDGHQRFEVIGSARTKLPTEYYRHTYATRKQFLEQFASPLAQRVAAAKSSARAVELRMESFALETGPKSSWRTGEQLSRAEDEIIGLDEVEASPDEVETEDPQEQAAAVPPEVHQPESPRPINLTRAEIRTLTEMPRFESLDDLADMITARNAGGSVAISDRLYSVMEKILTQDPHFFTRVLANGLAAVLRDCGLTH